MQDEPQSHQDTKMAGRTVEQLEADLDADTLAKIVPTSQWPESYDFCDLFDVLEGPKYRRNKQVGRNFQKFIVTRAEADAWLAHKAACEYDPDEDTVGDGTEEADFPGPDECPGCFQPEEHCHCEQTYDEDEE